MLVYYFVPFIVSNRYLLFWFLNGHNSVTVQNRTHVYMNFFDHKDLGNHLLQLCPKVVKHPVFSEIFLGFIRKEEEMGPACGTRGTEATACRILVISLRQRKGVEDLSVNKKESCKWCLKKCDEKLWNEFFWLMFRTGVICWGKFYWNCGFHKRKEISWKAEQLLTTEQGLYCIKWVSCFTAYWSRDAPTV